MRRALACLLLVVCGVSPAWAAIWGNGTAPVLSIKMIDSADHISAKTGLTVTCKISRTASSTILNSANSVTEIDATNFAGWYRLLLTASETGTNGDMAFRCTATGADDTDFREQIVAYNPTDNVRLGLSALPNKTTTEVGGTATVSSSNGVFSDTRAWRGTDVISTAVDTNLTKISGAAVATGSAQLGVNLVNIAGAAVNTATAQLGVNTVQWRGTDVIATSVDANVRSWRFTDVIATTVDSNVTKIAGSAVSTSTAQFGVNLVTIGGAALNTATAQIGANVVNWRGTDVIATSVDANVAKWLGTAPAAVTSNGYVQAMVLRWLTDNAGGTPNALTNNRVPIAATVQKNVAFAGFMFVVTDSTNHAPTPGLPIVCTRAIDGAAFGAGTLAATASIANGVYSINFGAGDLNGGNVVLRCAGSGADDTLVTLITYP